MTLEGRGGRAGDAHDGEEAQGSDKGKLEEFVWWA